MENKIRQPKPYKCVICKDFFNDYGNNPQPIKKFGLCCDECNKLVIAERIKQRYIDLT